MAREPGARRKKLAGYLKAANEIRQSYQQAYIGGRESRYDDEDASMPGSFTDGTVVRSGNEEMLLFPSYARRHVKIQKEHRHERPGSQDLREDPNKSANPNDASSGPGDAEYWRKEWEKYEDDNAVVDVDIRGWIFAPQRGQMTRKNRILVGMARRLSGIPAPASSRASSPNSPHHARMEARAARHEDELAEKEAQKLESRGQGEADVAEKGGYSEPSATDDRYGTEMSSLKSREPSPNQKEDVIKPVSKQLSNTSLRNIQKLASWNQPADMSSEELSIANAHLMVRLKPFLTTPLASIPLTVFFYNDKESKSRTITTNESGHFIYRAALDFMPSDVRVLASEELSATEEVHITESTGVSVISDIDDTIKHSAISAGAREIFRNAFIRELDQLSIEGVKEWYQTLSDMGVKFHYVSNSPWQFYPVLTSFFAAAGLPKGSFHLKQYSGMLQGIFEPVAERKKSSLDKIIADFPERRFILVGDSGEADLELYTDIMLANPSRIIAVFIRDVTTSQGRGFFDATTREQSPFSERPRGNENRSASFNTSLPNEKRPALPPRPSMRSASTLSTPNGTPMPKEEKLIDIDDEPPAPIINYSKTDTSAQLNGKPVSPPPIRPAKPLTLRPPSSESQPPSPATVSRKAVPPIPPKPKQYASTTPTDPSPLSRPQTSSIPSQTSNQPTSISNLTFSTPKPPTSNTNPSTQDPLTYATAVRNKVSAAYNSLPSFYASNLSTQQPSSSTPGSILSNKTLRGPPPVPPPPRRGLTSTINPSSSMNAATNPPIAGSGLGDSYTEPDNPDTYLSKKEELWLRRWQYASKVFKEQGVMLRSWRVGLDVADECVRVVERALREGGKKGGDDEGSRKGRKEE